jgi:hypothetical protein
MDWLCPGYTKVLSEQLALHHGNITAELAISDIVAYTQTGNLGAASNPFPVLNPQHNLDPLNTSISSSCDRANSCRHIRLDQQYRARFECARAGRGRQRIRVRTRVLPNRHDEDFCCLRALFPVKLHRLVCCASSFRALILNFCTCGGLGLQTCRHAKKATRIYHFRAMKLLTMPVLFARN